MNVRSSSLFWLKEGCVARRYRDTIQHLTESHLELIHPVLQNFFSEDLGHIFASYIIESKIIAHLSFEGVMITS